MCLLTQRFIIRNAQQRAKNFFFAPCFFQNQIKGTIASILHLKTLFSPRQLNNLTYTKKLSQSYLHGENFNALKYKDNLVNNIIIYKTENSNVFILIGGTHITLNNIETNSSPSVSLIASKSLRTIFCIKSP